MSGMKLNWFSPLPPAKTDIAHYTKRLLPALSSVAEVRLWTDQRTWDRELEKFAEVRAFRFEKIPWVELNRADMNFYQIGNNPRFHGTIWQISRAHPGVVVLHDFHLHHFFDGLYRVKFRDLDSYLAVMETYYGAEGRREAAHSYQTQARGIDHMAQRYPLTQLALENALGVIVHTPGSFESLRPTQMCPLVYAPLAFPASNLATNEKRRSAGPPYRLILFGYIGRNRRLDSVLRALAALPEKDKFHLDIYGSVLDGERYVHRQVRALELRKHVTVHGFAPEAKLDVALSQATLAINLRFPTMGEASGSQLRIWAHALPSLVSDVGWYASLPADTVALVSTNGNEVEDIQKHLLAFLANPDGFALMGERGQRVLSENHSPESYAATIVEMAELAKSFRPYAASLMFAEKVGANVTRWFEGKVADQAIERAARQLFALVER